MNLRLYLVFTYILQFLPERMYSPALQDNSLAKHKLIIMSYNNAMYTRASLYAT